MDPVIDSEWLGCKHDPIEEAQNVGNIARSWQWRERGIDPLNYPSNKTVFENIAEDILVQKPLKIRSCDLPGYPRSTFLMVFSPDGTKVASTHGNHNVYVSELASGKHVRILKGHPRTPWCIAFHPSHPQLIGSGCLGGQVRVWDIASGGSEVWNVRNETVIASIAFHPREQLLVIATYNELYFWDWSQPAPFTKVSTNNVNEKVRYVAFDALGYKLITGISLWPSANNNPLMQQATTMGPTSNQSNISRRDDPDENTGTNRPQDSPGSAQDMIVNSYQNLVQRYDSLVRNYQRLFMVRHRLTNTPPPPNTIDRGTDPMETDLSPGTSSWSRPIRSSTPTAQNNDEPTPGPSRSQDGADTGDVEVNGSRLLNLDVLSFDSDPSRNQASSSQDGNYSLFRSRSSAFQPLNDTGRSFRTVDQNERTTRLLPNPFSSSNGSPRPSRVSFRESVPLVDNSPYTSRTSIFTSSRPGSTLARDFTLRRRNLSASLYSMASGRGVNAPLHNMRGDRQPSASASPPSAPPDPAPSTSASASTSASTSAPRPTMTNSSTQMSPVSTPVDAQTINESLDLIRDILRDSGTRLLNLITNMSLSTLASVERSMPRRGAARAQSEEAGSGTGARPASRPQRLYSPTWRRSFLSSSSDSDSDSLEVNIFRTRNSTFREDEAPEAEPLGGGGSAVGSQHPTDRMVFELNDDAPDDGALRDTGGINVSLSSRFRVRTQSYLAGEDAGTAARDEVGPSSRESAGPSTRDIAGPSSKNSAGPSTRDSVGPSTRDSAGPFSTDSAGPATLDAKTTFAREGTGPSSSDGAGPSCRDGANKSAPEGAGLSTCNDAGPSPSQASQSADAPTDTGPRPSTSRDNFWTRGCAVPPDEAYRKVRSGVNALQKHTMQLTNLWLRGNRTTMRELRNMWENLRRRILMLHRETGRQDLPSYYTRSLLERCMILTEMSDSVTRPAARIPRNMPRSEEQDRNNERNRDIQMSSANATNSTENGGTEPAPDSVNRSVIDGPPATNRTQTRSFTGVRSASFIRRRLQSSYRWRPEDELRRRSRNPTTNRLSPRYPNRSRRDFARAIEISATRHEIRMRAMQVLSVMFNMMMMCLEERGLSQLIINMLRTLKKALALTCLMLMTNRNNGRAGNNPTTSQRVDSLNVVRIQNVDHTGPVNVDGPDDPVSPQTNPTPSEESTGNCFQKNNNDEISKKEPETESTSTSQPTATTSAAGNRLHDDSTASSLSNDAQRWSNRLAVQIAAANRNYSVTARNRRDMYLESRRLKALHRTNPGAHPIIKRRAFPPLSTHRIPALRSLPSRANMTGFITPRVGSQSIEPVAGPSNANDNNAIQDPSRNDMINEFEHRVNFIRLAHMQAVRLRNAARSRFRRLQTIRLYTPSSVREMFTLQNNSDNPQENRSPLQNSVSPDVGNRRPIAMYRPHILAPRSDTANRAEEYGRFHTVLNNVAMPLMQVNNIPTSAEAQESPTQRLPRIHEYLQPIILAQNAMVVDEEGGGSESNGGGMGGVGGSGLGPGGARRMSGMAGLLDAGILSEALPAPSHRVQAWDFTTGDTPDIADCTKNVVVQRCRIHNDASIDISKDGRLLVALLPVPRLRNTNHWLGVYSLEWARLGQCLHTAVLEQSAVSVALSPTARHLAVGLGSRRFTTAPHARNNVFALLYRLDPLESSSRTGLSPIKELEQNWEYGFTSLNCLRWAPQPGQGLVYANNTGQLIIMS